MFISVIFICVFSLVTGLYFFTASFSGINVMFGAVIRKNGVTISAEAYLDAHGAATTSATVVCRAQEQVFVWVTSFGNPENVDTYQNGNSRATFVGLLIKALPDL